MDQHVFEFSPLAESELPLLADWLARPHLQKWWREDEITPDKIRKKYLPRIFRADDARPFLVFMNGISIGYIQYYHAWTNPGWWPDTPGQDSFGIDQFIADEQLLGKGIGTQFISSFIKKLVFVHDVKEVRVDPRPDNKRAIRCYEKIGFKNKGEIITPDGPAVLMIYKVR